MTEKRLRRFDGAYRWFQIAAAPVQDGQANLIRWCGINTDIDDLKCSEQRFRQDAADLRTITDAIRDRVLLDMAPGCPDRLDSDFPKWILELAPPFAARSVGGIDAGVRTSPLSPAAV